MASNLDSFIEENKDCNSEDFDSGNQGHAQCYDADKPIKSFLLDQYFMIIIAMHDYDYNNTQ